METADRLHSIAIHLLRRARQEDRATGLTPERLSLLSVLVYAGAKTVSELAEIEMISLPAVTRTLNALQAGGLVRRVRSTTDRRQVLVHATDRGRELMDQGRRRRVDRIVRELESLSEADLRLLERATRVLESLDRGQRRVAASGSESS